MGAPLPLSRPSPGGHPPAERVLHGSARLRGLRRRRSAGAAMVEAVVTIPAFLVLFSASIFVWQMYLAKIRVQDKARFELWTFAISENCDDPGQPGPGDGEVATADVHDGTSNVEDAPEELTRAPETGADAAQGVAQVGNAAQTGVLSATFNGKTYAVSTSITASGILGGFTSPVSARRLMICNEPPHNGDLKSLAVGAYHTLTGWP